jgi:hypothetical protein
MASSEPILQNDVFLEINDIFDKNTLCDLKRFMNRRQNLNTTNSYLIYLFHLVQSAGILVSSIAASSQNQTFIWIGISLNVAATLINVYEKINNSMLKKLLIDIKAIKNHTYIDEGQLVDIDDDDSHKMKMKRPKNITKPSTTPINTNLLGINTNQTSYLNENSSTKFPTLDV